MGEERERLYIVEFSEAGKVGLDRHGIPKLPFGLKFDEGKRLDVFFFISF